MTDANSKASLSLAISNSIASLLFLLTLMAYLSCNTELRSFDAKKIISGTSSAAIWLRGGLFLVSSFDLGAAHFVVQQAQNPPFLDAGLTAIYCFCFITNRSPSIVIETSTAPLMVSSLLGQVFPRSITFFVGSTTGSA